MAYKDLRASLVKPDGLPATGEIKRMAEIQQVFFEIALENGLAEAEFFPDGTRSEEHSVVVYDKFTPHQS
ncbi:MAG: hypothetical protein ACR2IE_18160 [Candidatus Sumerlaeaceae bacterium]